MRFCGLLLFSLASLAGAQTPVSPLWTRPAFDRFDDLDVSLATSRTVVLTAKTLTAFPLHSSVPLWQFRTQGEETAKFSPDGTLVLLSGFGARPRLLNAATGAFVRFVFPDPNLEGEVAFLPPGGSPYLLAGANLLLNQQGFYRLSDGALIEETNIPVAPDTRFTADGKLVSSNGVLHDLNPDSAWRTREGSVFMDLTADGKSYLTTTRDNDRLVVANVADGATKKEILFPSGFSAYSSHRLGSTTRFAIRGYDLVSNLNYAAVIILDVASGRVLDHRSTDFQENDRTDAYAKMVCDEGSSGYIIGVAAQDVAVPDSLIEAAVDASGHVTATSVLGHAARSAEFSAAASNDAGVLAVGSNALSGVVDLLDGATGTPLRQILGHPAIYAHFAPFEISPSGKFCFFNRLGSGTGGFGIGTPTAASIANGAIANQGDFTLVNLFPLADDTLLGTVSIGSRTGDVVTNNERITRSGTALKLYRNYPDSNGGTAIGASADGTCFLTAEGDQLHLYSVSSGKQTAYTGWDAVPVVVGDVQSVLEGDGFIVVAKRILDEPNNHLILDIRRYARQGTILTSLGSAVRRTYPYKKTVDGKTVPYEIEFKLSPDGRAVWCNYQRDENDSTNAVTSEWVGEWIRTADGASLGRVNDPGFDYGAAATAIDPLNRRGYLSRQDGTVQAVPLANALGSILPPTFEVVGGTHSQATFRLLRPAESSQSYTASATGVTLDSSSVAFAAGARDGQIGFTVPSVTTSQDATIKATDAFGTVSTRFRIVPPTFISGAFVLPSVTGGDPDDLDLNLNGPAPAGGKTITLTDNSSALFTPASATVPAGATTVRVHIASKKVSKATVVTVTARLDGKAVTARVTLNP